jgi:hypothetical protein
VFDTAPREVERISEGIDAEDEDEAEEEVTGGTGAGGAPGMMHRDVQGHE